MRYLFLVIAAFFVIGCGKSPVQVENHYYFSGETLLKINLKGHVMDSISFDATWGMIYVEYYFPFPVDIGPTYVVTLPSFKFYAGDPAEVPSRPVIFIDDTADENAVSVGISIDQINARLICWAVSKVQATITIDSATVFHNVKTVMDKSWFTYQIQRAVDVDSL